MGGLAVQPRVDWGPKADHGSVLHLFVEARIV